MASQKKPVLRRCVGCGEMKDRKELIRVVKTPDGEVLIDDTQKMNGRGAYVCRSLTCLETAIKRRGLERTLKCGIDKDACRVIREKIEASI